MVDNVWKSKNIEAVNLVVQLMFTRRGDWVEWEHNKVLEALTLTFMYALPPDTQHLGPRPPYTFLAHFFKFFHVTWRYVSHVYSMIMPVSGLLKYVLLFLCCGFHLLTLSSLYIHLPDILVLLLFLFLSLSMKLHSYLYLPLLSVSYSPNPLITSVTRLPSINPFSFIRCLCTFRLSNVLCACCHLAHFWPL